MRTSRLSLFSVTALMVSLAAPAAAFSCPRSTPPITAPLGIASTDISTVNFQMSRNGTLTVKRTLSAPVPATAVSCVATLEGRYSRKLTYSRLRSLGTKSSLNTVINFIARRLPSVRPDVFRKQIVQPTLHVRVKTECLDKDGLSVLSDTTPVVARYVECGFSEEPVGMGAFINTLVRKLSR